MESVELEINGRMNTIHSDGSISWMHAQWNRMVNSFGSNQAGYRAIHINGKTFLLHRITARAFFPTFSSNLQVDHINGDRSDNRVENLRMVTNAENQRACVQTIKGATSQFRGVCLPKKLKKWVATICINGKVKHLGSFTDEIDAAEAYDTAAVKAGFFSESLNFPLRPRF